MHATRAADPTRLIRLLALLFVFGALLALAGPVLAADAAEVADAAEAATRGHEHTDIPADQGKAASWGAFFGRLHVVVLHLPIGLLIGAFTLEVFGLFRRSRGYDVAAAWLFVLGFASAVVAVVTGLLLGTEKAAANMPAGTEAMTAWQLLWAEADKGVTETLNLHMWLGVGLMLFAGLAAVLKIVAVRKQWPDEVDVPDRGGWPLGVTRLALVGVMVLLPLAGHLGGNLVHSEEYLFARAPFRDIVPDAVVYWPNDPPGKAEINEEDAEVFGTVSYWNKNIQPQLNDHCIACHGPSKDNGDLRLDSLAAAMKGGSIGPSIEAGEARYSELYVRVSLPESHDEFMPTNVKKHGKLTPQEVANLGEWIQAYDGRLEDKPTAKGNGNDNGNALAQDNNDQTPEPAKPLIDPAAIRAIQDAGGSAQSLSQEENPDLLDVKYAYLKTLNPEAIAKIGNTADQVAWLDLQGSAFGDEAAQQLPAMPRLTKLNLKDTAITDAGLAALPDLPSVQWINLFGTAITDKGLETLARYTTLNKLYITGTKVTAEGVAKLREALPDTEVLSDFDAQFNFTQDEPAAEDKPEDKPEGEQTSAKPINTVCPVSGAAVKDGFVSTYKGKTVGFCCNNCKGKFDAEPDKFAGKLP